MWLSDFIKEIRESKGLRQQDVADVLGGSPTSVRQLEQRKNGPTLKTLVRLGKSLGFQVVLLGENEAHIVSEKADGDQRALSVEHYRDKRGSNVENLFNELSAHDREVVTGMLETMVEKRKAATKKRRAG